MGTDEVSHYVRCLKCHKILKCPLYDATCLLDHIRSDHPEISIIGDGNLAKVAAASYISQPKVKHTTTEEDIEALAKQTGISSRKINTMAGIAGISKQELASAARKISEMSDRDNRPVPNDSQSNVIYKRKFVVRPQDTSATNAKCKLVHYRNSIKAFCSQDGVIYCPSCGNMGQPLKKLRSQITNICFSPCLLNCWPLCALPCINTPDETKLYLYCSCCNTFLGLYDCKNNSIRPNKTFVDEST